MSDNIKVVVKVRPLISREIEEKLSYQWRVKHDTIYQLDQNGREFGSYTFDKVYDKETKTQEVYNDIAKPIVEAAIAGFNGTIFAYGQTSSGKTYTMTGSQDSPGIIHMAVRNLFDKIKTIPDRDFLVRVSYIEIYNETLKDLLHDDKKTIKIQESTQGIKVDCKEKVTSSYEEVLNAMRMGEANRQTGATNMNEESSRSHSIFQITIESREHIEGEEESGCVNVSQLNLVDLAGSERAGQTGATGIRFKEGTHINKSLSVLGLVIKQLSEDPNKFANYRDSKLTRILQNSLGGNAKTSIICAITPASVEETISTLQFASRAKVIKNKPEVNAVATNKTMIQTLTKQLSTLQLQLESKKSLEQDNVLLQKRIANLQKLILNGFGQKSNTDSKAGRKNLPANRRATISTLMPIQEDPIPTVPKFCTPSLKYNPMVISGSMDFLPIQNANNLSSLPEEERLVTPPPRDKIPIIEEEIIDLDSDDDDSSEVPKCSPYHDCYRSSKTPPCVLRKNAKQAEQSLKDIVELTEREKMYTPSVVELMVKLDENTTVVAKLEEQINTLTKQGDEKDSELEHLRGEVSKAEGAVAALAAAKTELETLCKDYNTKLTDWEVSYETLKKKAKSREEELLSLLEERIVKRPEDPGKLSRTLENFMDMSKDISLVNSDNESSIMTINIENDFSSAQIHEIFNDKQTQLAAKNQTILELETNLLEQKQKIQSLEHSSHDLHTVIEGYKEKLSGKDNENSFLKSTIETLKATIESQKENLESSYADIKSYNNVVQELQTKLTNKEKLLNVKVNESIIENMIANEENFLANNENMKNIIQAFRIALDSRSKEIDDLKSSIHAGNEISNEYSVLKESVETKEKQIVILMEQVEKLKVQLTENVETISKLMFHEKELKTHLADVQESNVSKQQENHNKSIEIESLKETNNNLLLAVSENEDKEKEYSYKIQDLTKQIDKMSEINAGLEKEISIKNDIISSLNTFDKTQVIQTKAVALLTKMQQIISMLTSSTKEDPVAIIDDLEAVLITLQESLNVLETNTTQIIKEKEQAVKISVEVKEELVTLVQKHQVELESLQSQIESLNMEINNTAVQSKDLLNEVECLNDDLNKTCTKLNCKNQEILDLKGKLNETKQNNENLRNDLISKDNVIFLLQDKVSSITMEFEKLTRNSEDKYNGLEHKIKDLNIMIEEKIALLGQILKYKDNDIAELESKLYDIEQILQEKSLEVAALSQKLDDTCEKRNSLLENILTKATELTHECEIENSISCESIDNVKCYEQIMLTFDKIAFHIMLQKSNNKSEDTEVEIILTDAKKQIQELTEHNFKLLDTCSELDSRNKELLVKMEEIQVINKELAGSSDLLERLKTELKMKESELETMTNKAKQLKENFTGIESFMMKQMEESENESLKDWVSESEKNRTGNTDRILRKSLSNFVEGIENKSPQSLLTICCNRIIEAMEPKDDTKLLTTSTSKSSIEFNHVEVQAGLCECNLLSSEIQSLNEENVELKKHLHHYASMNEFLIKEREEVRKEVKLLMEPANELQKKISNHRTNLSTLTATNYAENKLLNSQLTVLKHYHTRYIHVCQRDIPAFKSQLHELMTILKGNPSYADKINASFKRYSLPDVLDSNTSGSNLKNNESTIDGDLLMLDTNVTLTTTADSTLVGHDHTCFDVTQINFDSEVACQTNELTKVDDPRIVYAQIESLNIDNQQMVEKLEAATEENRKLREQINSYSDSPNQINPKVEKIDRLISPIKIIDSLNESKSNSSTDVNICKKCKIDEELNDAHEKLDEEIKALVEELAYIKAEKDVIEKKYENLLLEIPSTEALVRKIGILDKEYNSKVQEIVILTKDLSIKKAKIKELQEENDTLSTQVMENIDEVDNLKKELDNVKEINSKMNKTRDELELLGDMVSKIVDEPNMPMNCAQCLLKDELINSFQNKLIAEGHSKLNRSLSESESSSRYNKICTLQSELHASKEDCKKITQEVATIKNQLERSNLSLNQAMDLDESMGDTNIFAFTKDFEKSESNLSKFSMPNIPEECPTDLYTVDKIDCLNYFVEKTGNEKDNYECEVKIIDIMKQLYDNLMAKHANEVENLVNKLKDFEESKYQLQSQVDNVTTECSKLTEELKLHKLKDNHTKNILFQLSNNVNMIHTELNNMVDEDKNKMFVALFKDNILKVLDKEFNLNSVGIFESLIDSIVTKHQNDLGSIMDRYTQLQTHMDSLVAEFEAVSKNCKQMKIQLSAKENEYDLLKAQKERIHEISNAVTLDIIKKDHELNEIMSKVNAKLVDINVISPGDIDLTCSLNMKINLLLDSLVSQFKDQNKNTEVEKEREYLTLEIKKSQTVIEQKEQQLEALKDIIADKDNKLEVQKSVHEDLNKTYLSKLQENQSNLELIENLNKEINALKENIAKTESTILSLESELNTQNMDNVSTKDAAVTELSQRIQELIYENETLKSVNDIITKENETCALELNKTGETIKKNKVELDRMTSDILVLRETINDNVSVIESLTLEAKSLVQQNEEIKRQFAEKSQDCSRLEMNIKTHEKTAEIQSKMIIRLQKQKEDYDRSIVDKDKQLEELVRKCTALQNECEGMKETIRAAKEEKDGLKQLKESLEARVSELETDNEQGNKNRPSIEAITENSRRRRQSLHDSRRLFIEDIEDHNKMEAVFESRGKPDDLFMDVDDEDSNRSTPIRLSRGRDSLLSRPDSDRDEDHPSRPSSVLATRRRRQSSHDLHRNALRHTPSPHDHPSRMLIDELNKLKPETSASKDSEVTQLRECLASCQQELEDLKERYRELDDECETCAQYLRERDEQCVRLKKEKTVLENLILDLNEKLRSNQSVSQADNKPSFAHASVNTDEDWANLHSVVVDRMSFDAEVEKNKKLTKTIEELRYKKQELNHTMAKMQKALEKHASYKENRELEATKSQLKECKQELEALRQQYAELDEECETCATYLREREAQCRQLRDAKAKLEAKLQEYQQEAGSVTQSMRKKRQSVQDQHRGPADLALTADTGDDSLSAKVEQDENSRKGDNPHARELKRVKMALDKVLKENATLQQQVTAGSAPAVHPTMYVATGSAIVQNQQLTDVMKENQKLKKVNAKLIQICKKRGRDLDANRENDEPKTNV